MGTTKKERAIDGPFDIGTGETAWYYVDRDSVTLVIQLHDSKGHLGTSQTILKKSELQRMLKLMTTV
jgi:hypothetical protein